MLNLPVMSLASSIATKAAIKAPRGSPDPISINECDAVEKLPSKICSEKAPAMPAIAAQRQEKVFS